VADDRFMAISRFVDIELEDVLKATAEAEAKNGAEEQ